MREADLLTRIYARSAALRDAFPRVEVGPGDDCAVLGIDTVRPGRGSVLLKTDQLIEGRHFVPGTPLDLIARKAIARAISDIAAMGGTPLACLAACALPRHFPQEPANQLFEACAKWAAHFQAPLVGGDIAAFATADAPLTLTITAIGEPDFIHGPVLRSGARPGDHLYITGQIGGSFDPGTGMGRHLTFEPRVKESQWLISTLGPRLHAMMDLSDGMGMDAGRMAAASGVEIELDVPRACLHARAGRVSTRENALFAGDSMPDPMLAAVSEGEDYELLFAVEPGTTLPTICPETGTALTRIGVCRAGKGAWLLLGGERADITQRGWEHQ